MSNWKSVKRDGPPTEEGDYVTYDFESVNKDCIYEKDEIVQFGCDKYCKIEIPEFDYAEPVNHLTFVEAIAEMSKGKKFIRAFDENPEQVRPLYLYVEEGYIKWKLPEGHSASPEYIRWLLNINSIDWIEVKENE